MIVARLYAADGADREVGLDALAQCTPEERELLWVDLEAASEREYDTVMDALDVPGDLRGGTARAPGVRAQGEHFRVDVVPVTGTDGLQFAGACLTVIAGTNTVITLHEQPIDGLKAVRAMADGASDVGVLSADSFTASLLDWTVSTYFEAVGEFERHLERLEERILDGRDRHCLDALRRLRRAASRMRRMLAAHRVVYDTLSRPDFRASGGKDAERHFIAVDTRFERAMDLVEHARELVIGSFELFSSQTALQTNRAMSRLTFATVVLGVLAVVSGMMGMNFDATFFAARDRGFWTVVVGMVVAAAVAMLVGRKRGWF